MKLFKAEVARVLEREAYSSIYPYTFSTRECDFKKHIFSKEHLIRVEPCFVMINPNQPDEEAEIIEDGGVCFVFEDGSRYVALMRLVDAECLVNAGVL